ncbi:phenylalanine--tRNA ligase beta subunit-related protein [uncultured Bacteroides sp.]|jgi:DNA/RNA-binding domain of Phe-tRNA-synthetase-like protein|uniref:B3/B4 domain-containing protein n=1 Tax=uncultured Bacteroides sp. TaxID=162156 RepID=UPI00280C29CC|nr:phenylalanine--tRNA ligase beta subunit-related protein [uncultured Bacteroides sp.]
MKILDIRVSDELKSAWPQFKGAAVFAEVKNTAYNEELWKKIESFTELYRSRYTVDSIKEMPAIQATRQAYKKCGKDPSRYRPSSEALCRRILRGLSLYQIDTLVDLINLASINSGHSIGGFDLDKIQGDSLVLGIGKAGEPYEGIGRGTLNIEGMPVYRDAVGGVGTPTSDNERTKLSLDTTHLLAIMNAYSGNDGLEESVNFMIGLLKEFAEAKDIRLVYFE